MAVLQDVGRQALESADQNFSKVQNSLEAAARAGALDSEAFDQFNKTFKQAARRLNSSLPPEIDAETSDELRSRLVELLARDYGDAPSFDIADSFLMEMEAIRHIIRDLLQEQPPVELRDAAHAISLLEEWLHGLTQSQLAELLDYSPRQLQRLRGVTGKEASHRLQMVARLVAILRHAWTSQGVLMWFYRQRADLGGRTPAQLLDDAGYERDLINAARAGRVQGAA